VTWIYVFWLSFIPKIERYSTISFYLSLPPLPVLLQLPLFLHEPKYPRKAWILTSILTNVFLVTSKRDSDRIEGKGRKIKTRE
jgi:hypothetical protein